MKTYQGGCHCGAYTFEIDTDLAQVIECNCSHCFKKGLILTFVNPEQLRMTNGNEDDMTVYHFNKRVIDHQFCPVCGVQPFGRGKNKAGEPRRAVNVRCLDGVDIETLTITPVNGKEF